MIEPTQASPVKFGRPFGHSFNTARERRMRVIPAILVLLTLAAAYAAGRYGRGDAHSDLSAVASFRESLEQTNPLMRSYRFNGFLQTLSPENLEEALEALETRQHGLVEGELQNFLLAWASFDTRGALDWALSRSGRFKRKAAAAAMYAWAFHDPAGARLALDSLDDADATEALKVQFVSGWMRGERPEGVAEYIASQPAGIPRQKYMNALSTELMREGAEAVIRWVEAIPDDAVEDYKSVAFRRAANMLAVVDPIQASRWIEGHLDRDYSVYGPSAIGRRWVEQDPPAALQWLTGLPAGEVKDDAVRTAFQRWLDRDRKAAEAWVLSASPAEGVDGAVRTLVRRDNRTDPGSALVWAQRIHDPSVQRGVLIAAGQGWFRRDPEGARAWLAESGLPEDIQTAIEHPPQRKRRRARGEPRVPAGGEDETEGS